MGMFDYVECEYPLPSRPDWAKSFQTKSLNNFGDCFRISADGILWTVECKSGAPQERSNHTGSFEFYTMRSDETGYWVEYHALFDRGRIIGVVLRALDTPWPHPRHNERAE